MRPTHTVAYILEMERQRLKDLSSTSWHLRALHAIRRCRTHELGGHIDRCDCCQKLHLSYNSCRNRHCPRCQGYKREQWIRAREDELLNVPYFHLVFTLPSEFNGLALGKGKVIYGCLFKAAWQTLKQFGENPLHLGGRMGMIAALHTWGQNLHLHPHLHCIVPGGGLAPSGKWKSAKNKGKHLFDVKAMRCAEPAEVSIVFRAKYVALLRKSGLDVPQDIYDLVFNKKWVVYAKRPFGRPESVVEYLGRYTHKIAISDHRIQNVDAVEKHVTFAAKDYSHGGRRTSITLDTQEFIRRFQLHILDKGFTRIRHYGILSSSWKKEKLPALRAALATMELPCLQLGDQAVEARAPLQHRRCPTCKKGVLHTVSTFEGRGPPQHWRPPQGQKLVMMTSQK